MDRAAFDPSRAEAWQELCRASRDAWFWHTRDWCGYTANYMADAISAEASFLVLEGGEPVAVAPCMAMKAGPGAAARLAFGGFPVPWPAFHAGLGKRERREAERLVFEGYEAAARAAKLEVIEMFGPVLAKSFYGAGSPVSSLPLRYGYEGTVIDTQVVDVSLPVEALLGQVRKGHRAAIKRAARDYRLHRFCREVSDEQFAGYQQLHALAAGRVTRPQSTFDDMRRWVREGSGLLVGAEKDGKWAGFVLFLLYQQGAYYASSCKDPSLPANESVGHVLVWEALLACREAGIERVELGEQTYDAAATTPQAAKLAAIGKFKRGFGGAPLPHFLSRRTLA